MTVTNRIAVIKGYRYRSCNSCPSSQKQNNLLAPTPHSCGLFTAFIVVYCTDLVKDDPMGTVVPSPTKIPDWCPHVVVN